MRITKSPATTALFLLFLVSLFNYMDRYVLSVLLPSIKADFDFSDTRLGLVTTAFTIAYITVGIPLARWADQGNRKTIITGALTLWSAMTAACGMAQNFAQLAIARILVGAGEAGATPPSHSLIADYFPLDRRSTAIAFYSIGAPIGLMIGFVLASWLAEEYTWRLAFLVLGVPGLVLAAVVFFKLVEPERGQSDGHAAATEADETVSFRETVRTLLSSKAYRHFCFATGLYTVVYLAVVGWLPSYFVRSFGLGIADVGFWLAISLGIPQVIGMLVSGVLTDRLVVRDLRWYGRIPALAMMLSSPLFVVVFLTDNVVLSTAALFPAFLIGIFQGPASLAAVQALAHVRMRAMAVAIFFLIANLVGGTIGPVLTGWLSDMMVDSYGEESLRYALLTTSVLFGLWSALHYALGARSIAAEIRHAR